MCKLAQSYCNHRTLFQQFSWCD